MKFDDDQKQEWEELEFDIPGADEEEDISVGDQVEEAVQKLVQDTMEKIPEHAYARGEEDEEEQDEDGDYDGDEYDNEYDEDDDEDEGPRRKGGKKKLMVFGIVAAGSGSSSWILRLPCLLFHQSLFRWNCDQRNGQQRHDCGAGGKSD